MAIVSAKKAMYKFGLALYPIDYAQDDDNYDRLFHSIRSAGPLTATQRKIQQKSNNRKHR